MLTEPWCSSTRSTARSTCRAGDAVFFRRDTWHHAMSFGADQLRVLEFFAPPPAPERRARTHGRRTSCRAALPRRPVERTVADGRRRADGHDAASGSWARMTPRQPRRRRRLHRDDREHRAPHRSGRSRCGPGAGLSQRRHGGDATIHVIGAGERPAHRRRRLQRARWFELVLRTGSTSPRAQATSCGTSRPPDRGHVRRGAVVHRVESARRGGCRTTPSVIGSTWEAPRSPAGHRRPRRRSASSLTERSTAHPGPSAAATVLDDVWNLVAGETCRTARRPRPIGDCRLRTGRPYGCITSDRPWTGWTATSRPRSPVPELAASSPSDVRAGASPKRGSARAAIRSVPLRVGGDRDKPHPRCRADGPYEGRHGAAIVSSSGNRLHHCPHCGERSSWSPRTSRRAWAWSDDTGRPPDARSNEPRTCSPRPTPVTTTRSHRGRRGRHAGHRRGRPHERPGSRGGRARRRPRPGARTLPRPAHGGVSSGTSGPRPAVTPRSWTPLGCRGRPGRRRADRRRAASPAGVSEFGRETVMVSDRCQGPHRDPGTRRRRDPRLPARVPSDRGPSRDRRRVRAERGPRPCRRTLGVPWFTDQTAMNEEVAVDAVVNLTPIQVHEATTTLALGADRTCIRRSRSRAPSRPRAACATRRPRGPGAGGGAERAAVPAGGAARHLLEEDAIGTVHTVRGLGFGGVPPWDGYEGDPTPFFTDEGGTARRPGRLPAPRDHGPDGGRRAGSSR